MKTRLTSLIALILVLAFTLTGCAGLSNQINKLAGGDGVSADLNSGAPSVAASTPPSGAGSSPLDSDTIAKHNAYINLYNELVDRFNEVLTDYSNEFGWDQKIYIEDNFSGFSMYSTRAADLLAEAMPYADKAPAAPDADAALKALQPDLASYCQTLADAKTYFEDKNYIDDNYAKAQSYHDVIVGNYDALYDKVYAFLDAVDVMLEGDDELWLSYYQQQGMMIRFYALTSLLAGQKITAYFYENDIDASNIQDIGLSVFRPLYDEFVAAYTGYTGLVNGNSDAGQDEGISTLMLFNDDLSELKASLSELIGMLNSGAAFDDVEISIASMTDGAPENIISCVNSLLNDYNSL